MNILFVNHTFPPDSCAGSELCVLNLAKILQAKGYHVAVFYRFADHSLDEHQIISGNYEGVTTYKINHTYRHAKKFQNIYQNPIITARFGELLRELKPDIVHFHHITNLSLSMIQEAKTYGAKVIFTLHDYWLLCQRGQLLKEDLSLCHGPSDAACRSCLSKQLLRGWQQKFNLQLNRNINRSGQTLSLLDQKKKVKTIDSTFVGQTTFGMGEPENSVLLTHPPTEIIYTLTLEQPTIFKTAIGLHPSTYNQSGQGVVFVISYDEEIILKKELNPKEKEQDKDWHDVELILPPKENATLILKTTAQSGEDNQFCTAGWRKPEILLTDKTTHQISKNPILKKLASSLANWVAFFSSEAHEGLEHRKNWVQQVFNDVDLFVSPSEFLMNFFVDHGLPAEKIIFSDNGFCFPEAVKTKKISKPIQFGYIGTWIPSKGIDLAVKAFQSIDPQDAQLQVFGFFPGYDGYEHYEDELKLMARDAVEFKGKYEPNQLYEILAEIDCLIMPSIWWENSPMTIHEAFIAKVPVITADVGGMAEQIKTGGGLPFKHRDATALEKVIHKIIENPIILDDLRDTIPDVKSIQVQAEEMHELYQKILQQN